MGDVGIALKVQAFASIAFAAGVPAFVNQSGDFDAVIVDNGVGDISITFVAGSGLAAGAYAASFNVVGALAASQLTTFGIVDVSAREKRITVLREGAAGAVSALADVNFQVSFIAPGSL